MSKHERPSPPAALEPRPPADRHASAAAEGTDLFDYALLRAYAMFVLRAPRRHKKVALASFVAVLVLGIAALAVLPRRYHVQARILAQRNPVMWTLSNPNLARPMDWDAPTRAARETVLRRDNLTALCKQINFVDWYLRSRAPAVRWRDAIVEFVTRKKKSPEERLDELVDTLERRLWVEVSQEGTVTITFEWSDKEIAYNMVQAALQTFLEVRHTTEVSIVGEAISILENRAQKLREEIDATIAQHRERSPRPRPAAPARSAPSPARASGESQEIAQMKTLVATKLRTIEDLEHFRERRLAELQAQLTQQLETYAEMHPVIQTLRQNIEGLKERSPQIQALRNEVQDLEHEIVRRGGALTQRRDMPARVALSNLGSVSLAPQNDEDPRVEYERGQLRLLVQQYANVNDRIDAAKMEMDTVQAAFKYRYSVMSPAQMPKKPIGVPTAVLVAAIIFAAFLFMFFGAAVVDVRSGLVVEAWQLERQLSLPVLAEVRESP